MIVRSLGSASRIALIACSVALALSPSIALALRVPYFATNASAGGVLSPMAYTPQAIRSGDITYIAYQGTGLDPYVAAYDHVAEKWVGPYRAGTNPATWDTHGGPALLLDKTGNLHVFYGPHHQPLSHARTTRPGRIDSWMQMPQIADAVTYPQIVDGPGATPYLFLRKRVSASPILLDWTMRSATNADATTWTPETTILEASEYRSAYASVRSTPDGTIRMSWLYVDWLDYFAGAWARHNIYYAERAPDGTWRNGFGVPLSLPITPQSAQELCLVADSGTDNTNQMVAGLTPGGKPGILYNTGSDGGPDSHRYRFAMPDADSWTSVEVTSTDHIFDAAEWQVENGRIAAYVVAGGTPGVGAGGGDQVRLDVGGEIHRYLSNDGVTWSHDRRLDPGKKGALLGGGLYTPVQLVKNGDSRSRVIFQERAPVGRAMEMFGVYLAGDDGCVEATLTPTVRRVSSTDRYGQAAQVARTGFPQGASTVVLVSGEQFADALCATPLASAMDAPVLFTRAGSLPPATLKAIKDLRATRVLIVGGPSSVGAGALAGIDSVQRVANVERISGADRYDVAANVAARLRTMDGTPRAVYLANGHLFADGLAAASAGALRGGPVLLTTSGRVPTRTKEALKASSAAPVYIVGGTSSIDATVAAATRSAARFGGADRYAVAAAIADHLLSHGASPRRVVVATGADFPDAMAAGVLSARLDGVLVLTGVGRLPKATERHLAKLPEERLDALVIGGTSSVSSSVSSRIAEVFGR